ncbi:MAG TPA: glycosyltransferase, partial [Gammaproteobacteria bacterium]|nr:glycosyltransferase [Gammaproteobacteria bacterium]
MRTGIAVVIVNWNAGELLKECLDAVYRQTLMPNQVIVIDNASSDNSLVGLDERYPQLIISRQDSNLGFSVANNIALRDYVNTYWVALL